MIAVPELTEELLAALGAELGGLTFDDPNQKAFLRRTDSCDVQAVPGNGKTTLLVAKLALLSRNWRARDQGVCVVSHTNVAREEVQKRLGAHPTACAFLGYPHFIGTVTGFIDQYIALPYLRGIGWSIRRIDDDAFAAAAKALIRSHPTLRASARQRAFSVETWVSKLTLADNFAAEPSPQRLTVRASPGQPGPHSNSGTELEAIKAELVRRGLYRFADMHAIARRALQDCPQLAERLRQRFPLAILDEAQDTSGDLLALLSQVFQGGALQRLGDQNQTLYEDGEAVNGSQWQPAADAIPLDVTRRFGGEIAAFASRLTPRRPQTIIAGQDRPARRLLLTFDRASIAEVLPRYAAWVADHYGDRAPEADVRAVASRHNSYRGGGGAEWPKSLTDYYPAYRGGGGQGVRNDSLCGAMRSLAAKHGAGQAPRDSHAAIGAAIADYLDHRGFRLPDGHRVRSNNIWPSLALMAPGHPVRVRELVLTHVVRGRAGDEEVRWNVFCDALHEAFPQADLAAHGDFCAFNQEAAVAGHALTATSRHLAFGPVNVQLGSVHSVKGMTADAVLMVETQVYRGNAANQKAMDLATVMPHAFGLEQRNLLATEGALTAATNVFVATTRPREMLALAVRRSAVGPCLIEAAVAQGWEILSLETA